jgi:lipoprotein signal peptidase
MDVTAPLLRRLDPGVVVGALTFFVAIAVDLYTKAFAVSSLDPHLIYYNHSNPSEYVRRIVMSLVAIGATYGLDRGARHLGIGRLWGAWIGAGMLTGGVLGNGVSRLIWARGVPDFLFVGRDIWNVADFEIGIGLAGGIASIAITALFAFARERLCSPPEPAPKD